MRAARRQRPAEPAGESKNEDDDDDRIERLDSDRRIQPERLERTRLARSVLGKDSVRAHRMLSRQAAVYVLPFDFPMAAWHVHRETLQYPRAIRWFDSRVLAAGLGQQRDQEHVSRVGGLRCLPVFE